MTDGNNHPSGVTNTCKELIQKSWAKFNQKGDVRDLGIPMFSKLFKERPEVKPLFRYDDSDPDRNKKLRSHVKLLFDTIGLAVDNIEDLGSLTPVMIQLGTRHHYYGVNQEYYLIFGECLVYAIETALTPDFSKDEKDAWMTFYYWLGGCIVKGMSISAAQDR